MKFTPYVLYMTQIQMTAVFLIKQGWLLRNVNTVTFYRYKMYHIFWQGRYDIFDLKQNNLLIIKVFFLIYYLKSC